MTVQNYIDNLNKRYQTGISREHAYRGDLQQLLERILKDVQVINEPARIACGAPDYILTRKDIPVGYIEAKDVGVDLNSKSLREQFERYKGSLSNLIFTDYLDFHFYRDGVFVNSIRIGEIRDGVIVGIPNQYNHFEQLIKDFAQTITQSIKSPTKLAEMMAGKARLLGDIIEKAVSSDEENDANSQLKDQYNAFKNVLVHDITQKSFADMYAQTIAYGMFAARYHDPTIPTFSREEAATLIPHSNPFLRKLFQSIAGYDLDIRIAWVVDDLVQIFLASDVAQIMRNFGKSTKQEDPIIHFYETFLAAYDPSLRKSRGVWYTPEPVVNFIVRAVDDILKTEFNLPQGLADTSKVKIRKSHITKQTPDRRSKNKEVFTEEEIHKVQVLDPATGTGTFLAEIIKHIHQKFKNQAGIWPNYVEKDLIPRLNGFELLMTSYAMAHLKMDILLTETGYTNSDNKRFKIFLTNSLEEAHENQFNLFTQWLSQEANEANAIKRDTPVMCVIGNPPYSGESSNKSEWIMKLMEDYKKEPGGKVKLKERNPKWINDDYVKFIRFGQNFIQKNGEGVMAFINPHGFLDNPTFRGMRWSLLNTFDKIYTIDLHGNSKKKETALDGSLDQNVFDIMQGVSINIFVKTGKKTNDDLGKVYRYDLYGKRDFKYNFLSDNSLKTIPFTDIPLSHPMYSLVPKNLDLEKKYNCGFSLTELFPLNNVGIVTARDEFTIHHNANEVQTTIEEFLNLDDESARKRFNLGKDVRDWQVNFARKDLLNHFPNKGLLCKVSYRPFDDRWTYYTGKSKGFHCYPRFEVMQHFLDKDNIGLDVCRQLVSDSFSHVLVTDKIVDDSFVSNKSRERGYLFPLYIYPSQQNQQSIDGVSKIPNFDLKIVEAIASGLNHVFVSDDNAISKPSTKDNRAIYPLNILDYIYAVLHSPAYRKEYQHFLKIDFPKVPFPKDPKKFWQLVNLGQEIREIHLFKSPKLEVHNIGYPENGHNVVTKPQFILTSEGAKQKGRVFINEKQYFSEIPEIAWNFNVGGYQPAQKWLKDRKDKELNYNDILHYQKIIAALVETDRLMMEIDKIGVE